MKEPKIALINASFVYVQGGPQRREHTKYGNPNLYFFFYFFRETEGPISVGKIISKV